MKSCLIIGGGLAGLAAGVHLTHENFKVTILEQSPRLGGRASARPVHGFEGLLDNGQHIIMGCYSDTLKFMRMIDAADNLVFQDSLDICYKDEMKRTRRLHAPGRIYPLNLLMGLLNYSALTFREQIKVIQFLAGVFMQPKNAQISGSLLEWLENKGQAENIRDVLWDFLAIGALNTDTSKADAGIFAEILRRVFFAGNFSSTIILPKYDLSRTFIEPAVKFICQQSGTILHSTKAVAIKTAAVDKICVTTQDDKSLLFENVIMAIPPYSLAKVDGFVQFMNPGNLNFTHSSILTAHILLQQPVLAEPFYGLLRSPVHWVFNHGSRLTVVISDADRYMTQPKEALEEMIKTELSGYLGIDLASILHCVILKERRATFIPDKQNLLKRPTVTTRVKNLFMAGDWVNTGLPATIEGAICSGRMAAEAVIAESD